MSPHDPAQLTVRAIILSLFLAVLLAAANAYLGLFAGLTVATAIPAAVVSMGVLRLLGRSSILENNIVATGASAASSIAAGTIFTIPALVIMGHWARFEYGWVLAIAGLGGLLGVLFSMPLRRTLIIDQKLQFPEGVATAEVLKVGENPGRGLKALALAAAAGASFKLALSGLRLSPESFVVARYFGERGIGFFGINLSPALLGVGFIVGFNIGCLMLSGGALSWWVFIPFYNTFLIDQNPALAQQLVGLSAEDAAGLLWSKQIRYLGVGAMLIGGLWSLLRCASLCCSGVRTGLALTKAARTADVPHTERDLPMKVILIGIVLFVLPLFALYYAVVGSLGIAFTMAVIMVVAGFVFSSVSGYMAGLVGSLEQPGLGHHDLDDPVRLVDPARAHGPREHGRAGRRHHDRRRHLLRGRDRRRQPPGPEGGPAGRRDAVAAAGNARRRCDRLGRDHGADPQPAARRLRHRPPAREAQRARSAAGDADGLGRERRVRRGPAVGHGRRSARSSARS